MTTKASSKDAMNDAEGLHVPCSCIDDETHKRVIAEALDDIAAGAVQNIVAGYAAQLRVASDYADALRARNVALVEAVTEFLDHGDRIEKCSVYTCPSWNRLRAALAADAKAGEDATGV